MLDCAAILFHSLLFCLGRPSRLVGRVCDFDAHTPGGEVKMPAGILEPAKSKDFSRRFFYMYTMYIWVYIYDPSNFRILANENWNGD